MINEDKEEYLPLSAKDKAVIVKALLLSIVGWFVLIRFIPGIIFYYFAGLIIITAIYIYNDQKKQKKLKSLNFFKSKQ